MAEATFGITDERAKRLIAMGQMAASLAHEIRNPLGSMELFCTLLKKDLAGQPQTLGLAEQIHLGIRTLDRIISNCLQFARDVQPRSRELHDTKPFLTSLIGHAASQIERSGVAVTFEELGNHPAEGDPDLLVQAFLNLLSNAIEAADCEAKARSAKGQAFTPRVVITSDRRAPGSWVVRFSDNGCGIPPDDVAQMFDPFFTTKEGGTGLGLAITHSIITAHRGTISVETNPREGTTISVTLPTQAGLPTQGEQTSQGEQRAISGG